MGRFKSKYYFKNNKAKPKRNEEHLQELMSIFESYKQKYNMRCVHIELINKDNQIYIK